MIHLEPEGLVGRLYVGLCMILHWFDFDIIIPSPGQDTDTLTSNENDFEEEIVEFLVKKETTLVEE